MEEMSEDDNKKAYDILHRSHENIKKHFALKELDKKNAIYTENLFEKMVNKGEVIEFVIDKFMMLTPIYPYFKRRMKELILDGWTMEDNRSDYQMATAMRLTPPLFTNKEKRTLEASLVKKMLNKGN